MQKKEVKDRLRNVIRIAKRLSSASPMDQQQIRDAEELVELEVIALEAGQYGELCGILLEADRQLDAELDVCSADENQENVNILKEQQTALAQLLGRIA